MLPLLPVFICLMTAILQCFFWFLPLGKKILHITAAFFLLAAVIWVYYSTLGNHYLILQMGNYPAPFGITFVIDKLSAIMLLVTAFMGLSVALYSLVDRDLIRHSTIFYPTYWFLLAGICGGFSTGDLFNLYVWFEIMLISSFILMTLSDYKIQLDGTLKYVVLNLIATILMLSAIAMLYGITGTLNMAAMSAKLLEINASNLIVSAAALLCLAFAIKAAVFPLFFWLPASYHTTSVSASAIFAAMLTKVGVYALIRVFTLLFIKESYFLHPLMLGAAGLTMLTGVLGAAAQHNLRRILSFHIISQIGYMLMGLAIFTPLAMTATLFFMIHNIIVKTNLFLISGIVRRVKGSFNITRLGGILQNAPFLSFLFFISAFSLAGSPPLSGFWGKLFLLKAAFVQSHFFLAAIALSVSFLTLYSMTKIWHQVFWKAETENGHYGIKPLRLAEKIFMFSPVVLLIILTLYLSFSPQFLFQASNQASIELFNPQNYISAILRSGS